MGSNGHSESMGEFARELLSAGMCVVPATAKKHPIVSDVPELNKWRKYQIALPHPDELDDWFFNPRRRPYGMGFVCGRISGGLEVLDLDTKHDPTKTLNARAEAAIREYVPGLWERLVIESTPTGGLHLYFRCSEPEVNLKLAFCINSDGKRMAVAETRGEGGFIMAAPSPGYVLTQGRLTAPPVITDDERSALFAAARSLETAPEEPVEREPERQASAAAKIYTGTTPIAAYNATDKFFEVLKDAGWTTRDEKHWTRPGKEDGGTSATWDMAPKCPRHLHVFTPNAAPLEDGENYSPFGIYALLKWGGDVTAAAKQLYKDGLGDRMGKKPTLNLDDGVYEEAARESNGTHEAKSKPSPTETDRTAKLRAKLALRLFDHTKRIPKPRSIYTLAGTEVSTPGNLTSIYSQTKTGKSSTIGAMISAAMSLPGQVTYDTLGFVAPNPSGHALLHFDTEQSPYHWQQLLFTAMRRVGITERPRWLLSHTLSGETAVESRMMVELALRDAHAEFGGVHSVIVDGIADLVTDPNDSEECFPLITHLQGCAIEFDTAIVTVLHMNPGSDVKGRGHLGSQLERKSESNLVLEKDGDDTTKIYSTKQRGKAISKENAVAFRWSDEHQMHRTHKLAPSEVPRGGGRPETFKFSIFRSVFPAADAMPLALTELARRISTNMPISPKQLGNVIERWERDGFVELVETQGQPRRYRMAKI